MSSQLHLQDGCPKPAMRQKLSSCPTTIEALGDDLLLEIFLRLPSLATLTRAALTCRAWRLAVASCSPAFRRRFRELHRAPLLGVFGELSRVALPAFAAARSRDPDVVAAIRRVDFALSFLSEPHADAGDVPLRWRLCDCRDGRLLLVDWDAELLAIVNPLSRRRPDYLHMPLTETTMEGRRGGGLIFADVHLLSSTDDDLNSFRLVHFCCDESGVRASVFSSDTRDWSVHPWTEVAARAQHPDDHQYWLVNGMQADGFISWPFCNREHVLMLDTATMEFSVLELPPLCRMAGMNFVVTRRDGAPCVVYYYYGSIVGVKVHRVHDEDSWGRWSLGAARNIAGFDLPYVSFDAILQRTMAVTDGFVYLETSNKVMSLCLETMMLEDQLIPSWSSCTGFFLPYDMGWPRLLP